MTDAISSVTSTIATFLAYQQVQAIVPDSGGDAPCSLTRLAWTTVNNAAATANSLIFLTPVGNPQAFFWIAATNAGNFTIDASTAVPADVPIGFLIIN